MKLFSHPKSNWPPKWDALLSGNQRSTTGHPNVIGSKFLAEARLERTEIGVGTDREALLFVRQPRIDPPVTGTLTAKDSEAAWQLRALLEACEGISMSAIGNFEVGERFEKLSET
jgi:hypothetical protein